MRRSGWIRVPSGRGGGEKCAKIGIARYSCAIMLGDETKSGEKGDEFGRGFGGIRDGRRHFVCAGGDVGGASGAG